VRAKEKMVIVNDLMQKDYRYTLSAGTGRDFDPRFKPELTPAQMLRLGAEDERQIKRWLAARRHLAQLRKNCRPGQRACRLRQKQALLHWAYDTRKY